MGDLPPIALHSRYNPSKEAERFVDALGFPRNAAYVIVCEPAESYLCVPLRVRFPHAKLIAIRLSAELFTDTDGLWDMVWRPGRDKPLDFFLLNNVPDESMSLTHYLEWPPSTGFWAEGAAQARIGVKRFLEVQKRVMLTRTAFGPRWLVNMANNITDAKAFITPRFTSLPAFLAGAGPSLEKHEILARQAPLTVAVSSSLGFFKAHGIDIDLCVATDGGFWALRYFRDIPDDCPISIPLEAAVPREALRNHEVMALHYGSQLETGFFAACGVEPIMAQRNGTVSGTALELTLSLTDGPVYASGMDFSPSTGFHHARPHPSETSLRADETRLHTASSRLIPPIDSAMDVYADWFTGNASRFQNRFARITPSGKPIAGIQDRTPSEVRRIFSRFSARDRGLSFERNRSSGNYADRAFALIRYLDELSLDFTADAPQIGQGRGMLSGAALDFFQLADYRGFLEALPYLGRSTDNHEANDLLLKKFSDLRDRIGSLQKRIKTRAGS